MTARIDLTKEEIEVLHISLMAEMLKLEEQVRNLELINNNGEYTEKINLKKERIADCDKLFEKLFNAENRI